jgi:hypothetical protein
MATDRSVVHFDAHAFEPIVTARPRDTRQEDDAVVVVFDRRLPSFPSA